MDILSKLQAPEGAKTKRLRVGRGVGPGSEKQPGEDRKVKRRARRATSTRSTSRAARRRFSVGYQNEDFAIPWRRWSLNLNVGELEVLDDNAEVNAVSSRRTAWFAVGSTCLRCLGDGELTKKLTVVRAQVLEVRGRRRLKGRRQGRAYRASPAPSRRRRSLAAAPRYFVATGRESPNSVGRFLLLKGPMASLAGISNFHKVPELRRRVLFTLGMLAVYRIGVFVTMPGVNRNAMRQYVAKQSGLLTFFNMFSGGAPRESLDFRAGDHAVHFRVHHHPAHGHGLQAR